MTDPVFELLTFIADVHARLRGATPPPATVSTANGYADAMKIGAALPAAFTIYKGSRSSGRLVANSARQKRDPLKLFLGIVTRNINDPEGEAHRLLQVYERVLIDKAWTPATCLVPFVFDGDYLVMRDGPKVLYGAEFRTKAMDFV